MGCNVTFYALIGETGEKVRYLARRMDENTDMNSCFNDLDRYLDGKISLWRLVLPPGYKQVDAIG
jgi:hypothetical protein